MKIKQFLHETMWFFVALFLALFVCFQSATVTAKADTTDIYTDVLADLQKDENFDTLDYPANGKDYSLQVIQIAESTDKQLFVYVYQPSHLAKDLTATTIRIGLPTVGVDTTWKDYILTLVSTNGVFDKYKVEGLTVASSSVRYYDITAIHRAFDSTIDTTPDINTENTINEVVYEVAQLWTAFTRSDGSVMYAVKKADVVTITSKIVGYIYYSEGFKFCVDACHSHFVAFSCDYDIDKLMEVDLTYVARHWSEQNGVLGGNNGRTYDEPETIPITLYEGDKGENDGDGLLGKKYTWERIESVETFIKNEGEDLNLVGHSLSDLKDKQWILRFTETDYYTHMSSTGYTRSEGTDISDVTILRLKFIMDGETYNLGVVDNKQTGSDKPFASADTTLDDIREWLEEFFDNFWTKLLGILLLVVVIIAIITVLPWIISLIGKGVGLVFKLIGKLFKGLWLLICLPFNLIGKGVKKIKGKRNKKNE